MPAYGMPNYVLFDGDYATALSWFREASADTYPSLLISAWDYFDGSHDKVWLAKNYAGIRQWAEKMLATDRNGNGLIEYVESGNSGSWPASQTSSVELVGRHRLRPRGRLRQRSGLPCLGGMERLAANLDKTGEPSATAPPPTNSAKPTSRLSTIRPPACWRAGRAPTVNSTTTIFSGSTASPSITGSSPGPGQRYHGSPLGQDEGRGLPPLRPRSAGESRSVPRKDYVDLQHRLGGGKRKTAPTDSRSTRTAGLQPASPISPWPPSMTSVAARRPTASSSPCSTPWRRASFKAWASTA